MAMHRRPPSAKPPAELVTFDPEDWPHGPGEPADVTWYPSFQRWCEARRAWLAEHPESDALGDVVDLLNGEIQVQLDWMTRHPFERIGAAAATCHVITEGVVDPVTRVLRGRLWDEHHIPAGEVGVRYCDWDSLGAGRRRAVEERKR